MRRGARVALGDLREGERLHVHADDLDVGGVPHVQRKPVGDDRVRERSVREVDVEGAVQFGAVRAVHLAPVALAVGGEP